MNTINKSKTFIKASFRQRVIATVVFFLIAGFFILLSLAANDKIDAGLWTNPCGFKQRYDLPCPSCGMTTSALAFAGGRIFESFYIQPAGGFLCVILVVLAILAFITALFGVYFIFLRRFLTEIKVRYIVLAVIIIIAAGWIVTLARALAAKN